MSDEKNLVSSQVDEQPGCKSAEKSTVRPGYIRKADAARYLGISVRTLTDWMQQHIVPFIKISHRVCLFRQADLDTAMDRLRIKAVGEMV